MGWLGLAWLVASPRHCDIGTQGRRNTLSYMKQRHRAVTKEIGNTIS
jgi:hypothetical protein